MTYTRQGEKVILEMTYEDYERLTLMLGFACGAANKQGDLDMFYRWLEFANELNATNPNFTPYEIPEQYRRPPA